MKPKPTTRVACVLLVACSFFACAPVAHRPSKPPPPPPAPLLPASVAESWRTQQPSPGPAAQLRMPTLNVDTLENGVHVYCMPRSTGPVSISVVLDHGAEDTRPSKSGTAALTARLLVESTKRRNAHALAKAAETLGSSLSSTAQRDYVAVSLETLPGNLEQGIELLAEVVREPSWSPDDFSRVRDQWLDDLQAERQSPTALAAMVAMRALFGNSLGAPVNGTIPDVKRLALSDLQAWHKSFATPANVALIVSGPVEQQIASSAARRALSSWKGAAVKQAPVQYAPINGDSHRVIIVNRKEAVQSSIFVAQPFPARLEPGHEARLALNDIVGGLFTSRINMNLREKHAYTYGAHSTVISNRNFGVFAVQTSVRTDATAPALKELISELSDIAGENPKKPASRAELTRARADLSYRLGAHLESNRLLAADAENIFVQGLAPTYLSDAASTYASISVENIGAASRQLKPEQLTIVIVGDQSAIESPLRNAGFTYLEPQPAWIE